MPHLQLTRIRSAAILRLSRPVRTGRHACRLHRLQVQTGNRPPRRRWRRWLRRLGILLLALLFLALLAACWAFGVEPGLLTVTRYDIYDPDLPASWDGRVIAYFSDVHAGAAFAAGRLERAVRAMMAASPDLILFGGDLVDSETPLDDPDFTAAMISTLDQLAAPLGKFAVVGNHDTRLRDELALAKKMLRESGFSVLVNQSVTLDGIWLGGLDDSYFGQPDVAGTFKRAASLPYRLLLMHEPDYMQDFPDARVNLILSGHSHNGQVTLLGLPIFKNYQGTVFPYGYYAPGPAGRQLIVSRGLGTVQVHARLFAPPEVVLITLHHAS